MTARWTAEWRYKDEGGEVLARRLRVRPQSTILLARWTAQNAAHIINSSGRHARAFPDVSATIQKIYFDSPWHYGIKATAGKEVSILNNVVRNVQWEGWFT